MTCNSRFKKTIDWYEQNAEDYAGKIENSPDTALIDRFVGKLKKGAIVLDAGCAGGRDCRIFKDKGLTPIGLDISQQLVKLAAKKNPDIEFKLGSF